MEDLEKTNPDLSLREGAGNMKRLQKRKKLMRHLLHIGLFVVTLIGTTLAGTEWSFGKFVFYSENYGWADFAYGLQFSLPFLLILSCHEFGHYFTARYHNVKVTLPYYIPMWLGFIASPSLGTMGAIIRIKGRIHSRVQFFDIGISGPLAGFVVALLVLWYGFTHLPPADFIYKVHPEYQYFGDDWPTYVYERDTVILKADVLKYRPDMASYSRDTAFRYGRYASGEGIFLGNSLLFQFFKQYVVPKDQVLPHDGELLHCPWLLAGFLALFFTALNLLPIGQLDGGHIVYGLLGHKASRWVSAALFLGFIFYAGIGIVSPNMPPDELLWHIPLYGFFLYMCMHSLSPKPIDRWTAAVSILAGQFIFSYFFPETKGYMGWLLYGIILGRFLGIFHPPAAYDAPLDWKRKALGWLALIIFVLCWSPTPLTGSL